MSLSPIAAAPARSVAEAIETRRSTRAFLPDPIPRETIVRILDLAGWAPSGSNTQPWRVHVVTGAARARLGAAMTAAYLSREPGHGREYDYYTEPLFEPYLARRRACGWGLYGLLGLTRENKDGMTAQRARNYDFFGAPVALILTIDRRLSLGSWIDTGIFIQTLMLAARGEGLHTCPQAAIAEFPRVIRRELGIGEDVMVVSGIALGHADPEATINQFQPDRAPLDEFVTFLD
jgi:nitroreductase